MKQARQEHASRKGEIALAGAGVLFAGISAHFAITMIADTNRVPVFAGQEYLGIFAKPVGTASSPDRAKIARAITAADPKVTPAVDPGIDLTPVGTIGRAGRPPNPPAIVKGYSVRGIYQSKALVLGPNGFVLVQIGTVVPGLGSVLAIADSGGRVTVLTEKGLVAGQ